jgi:hypothetical protein
MVPMRLAAKWPQSPSRNGSWNIDDQVKIGVGLFLLVTG